jgi:hypothetical protein
MRQSAAIAPQGSNQPSTSSQAAKQTWWSSLSPEQRKFISNVAIGLGISVVALVGIYFATKVVRNKIANVEESKSLGRDDHATWAKQIKNAFDNNGWLGTDEVLLRNTLREIPSKEDFRKVQTSYNKLYKGENLIDTMTGELKQTEYNEMLAIVNSKPEKSKDAKKGVVIYDPHGWAKRLNAAINYSWIGLFWGTDEDAINAVVMELPSQQAFLDTAQVYKDTYGVALMEDLAGDLDSATIDKYRKLIIAKPKK